MFCQEAASPDQLRVWFVWRAVPFFAARRAWTVRENGNALRLTYRVVNVALVLICKSDASPKFSRRR